jgi:hypothetical protein
LITVSVVLVAVTPGVGVGVGVEVGVGVIAIPIGRSPTGMGAPGVLVARLIGVTLSLSRLTA